MWPRFDYDSAVHLSLPPTRHRILAMNDRLKLPAAALRFIKDRSRGSRGQREIRSCRSSSGLVCASVCQSSRRATSTVLVNELWPASHEATVGNLRKKPPLSLVFRANLTFSLSLFLCLSPFSPALPGMEYSILRGTLYDADKLVRRRENISSSFLLVFSLEGFSFAARDVTIMTAEFFERRVK